MDALRWILLLIGLVLIAGIYWLGRRQGRDERHEGLFERARRAARDDKGGGQPAADPVEPDLDIGDIDLHGFDVADRPGEARETPDRSKPADDPASRDEYADEPEAAGARPHGPSGGRAAAVDATAESPVDPGPGELSGEPPGSTKSADSPSGLRDDPSLASERASDTADAPEPDPEPVPEPAPRARGHDSGSGDRVVVLHVVAPEGERLVGARLREALESCGMRHGAYSIFHATDSEGSIVFSAANAVEPGTFDRTTMDTLTTPGIALFMQVPGAQSAETVFDRMLSTARSVADALEAHVLDERRSTLTRQTEQHLREELRLLDRRTGALQR